MDVVFYLILLFLLTMAGLILHECGHLILSRYYKVKVDQFAIGFGPTLLQKQYKGTTYQIKLLPVGGFCSINEDDLNKLPLHKKIIINAAGVVNNLVLAFVELQTCYILANPHKHYADIVAHTMQKLGGLISEFALTIPRTIINLFATSGSMKTADTYLQIGTTISQQSTTLHQVASLLAAAACLNLIIALFNLIPFPGLDGGHILMAIIVKVRQITGKTIEYNKIHIVNTIGLVLLIMLTGYILLRA